MKESIEQRCKEERTRTSPITLTKSLCSFNPLINIKSIIKFLFSFLLIALFTSACKENQKEEVASGDAKNQTLETIFNRKSVREYLDKEISPDEINDLLKAGMAAPSSRDRRPWQFIVVSDKAVLQNLGERLKTASCLKNANKAIVVCGDTLISDNCWFLDCSAATQNILLAAESMGIGAVWTAVYPYNDRTAIVNEVFQLPENIKPLTIIPLGYPSGKHTPKAKFDKTRIHYNKWD